ncbi:MAG: D-alanine--D-alanine ligase [Thermoflexaceae bacterium]|nr:D-alanine--D-alanine ligase [Thermoflexaceae bacterium]
MNIVVLAGGVSTERDVSIVTGTMVCNALVKKGHNAILVDVYMGYEMTADSVAEEFCSAHELDAVKVAAQSPDLETVKKSRGRSEDGFFGKNVLALCKASDIVFMALHGEDGENGKIQAAFDLLGIRYTGSGYLGSALAMNKDMAKEIFEKHHVPVPAGFTATKENYREQKAVFPCIVKPACGGSSVGVSIANNEEEYEKALEEAFYWEEKIVVEEYIKGREFSVGVVEGKACPIIEIAPIQGFYDYKNKYQAGSTVETCPAEISPELTAKMQKYACMACEALKLETYARVDFMMKENGDMYCLEANTLPGMTPTSLLPQEAAAQGISFEDLCEQLIWISLKKYEKQE